MLFFYVVVVVCIIVIPLHIFAILMLEPFWLPFLCCLLLLLLLPPSFGFEFYVCSLVSFSFLSVLIFFRFELYCIRTNNSALI